MKKLVLIVIIISISVSIFAEINPKKAAIMSALIPGTGEIYTGNYKKAGFFLGTEILILFSYLKLNDKIEVGEENYKKQALQYADIVSGNYDDNFYQTIQQFDSIETYNNQVIQDARNYYLIYMNDEQRYHEYLDNNLMDENSNYWHWQNKSKWADYQRTRNDYHEYQIWTNMTLGFMLVNRLISVVDSTISAKSKKNRNGLNSFYVKPNLKAKSVMLGYKYEF